MPHKSYKTSLNQKLNTSLNQSLHKRSQFLEINRHTLNNTHEKYNVAKII